MFDKDELLDLWYVVDFYVNDIHKGDEIDEGWIKLLKKLDKKVKESWNK